MLLGHRLVGRVAPLPSTENAVDDAAPKRAAQHAHDLMRVRPNDRTSTRANVQMGGGHHKSIADENDLPVDIHTLSRENRHRSESFDHRH